MVCKTGQNSGNFDASVVVTSCVNINAKSVNAIMHHWHHFKNFMTVLNFIFYEVQIKNVFLFKLRNFEEKNSLNI